MSVSRASESHIVPVAPPTPQEITRKLSVHNKPQKPHVHAAAPVSGTESDSDAELSPPGVPASGSAREPLSSIAERRRELDGEESDEDDDEDGDAEAEAEADAHAHGRDTPRGAGGDSVLKAGYLWKKGERRKTWKKRWVVLRPAHLAFYKSSAEYKLLRLLDLPDVHACTPVALKRHAHAFGLVCPARTYYLRADSADGVRAWVAALASARAALLAAPATQAPPPAPTSAPVAGGGTGAVPVTPARARAHPPPPPGTPSPPFHAVVTSESDSDDAFALAASPVSPGAAAVSPPRGGSGGAGGKDPSKAVLSGYLMKCRSKRRTWRKRWFVLTGEKLLYCANHMDTKRQRSIELAQILDALEYDLPGPRHHAGGAGAGGAGSPAAVAGEDADGAHGAHTFKIVTTERALLLCAPSEEEEIRWLSAVRALIARRSGAGGEGPYHAAGSGRRRSVSATSGGGAVGDEHGSHHRG